MENIKSSELLKITCENSEATFRIPKLIKLILNGITIIDLNADEKEEEILSSGSYLMYPWAGRIKNDEKIKEIIKNENYQLREMNDSIAYPFKDGSKDNFPLHGFFANSKREILKHENNILILSGVISETNAIKNCFPNFIETFKLFKDRLEVITSFKNSSNNNYNQYFAYGYHPYISLLGKKINDLVISSNLNKKIKLTENVMPEISESGSLILNDCNLNSKLNDVFYDDLFYKAENSNTQINPYVSLYDEVSKTKVILESNNLVNKSSSNENSSCRINLNYFQIYTPPSRHKIAIEPMSSPSNAYSVDFPNYLVEIKPNEEKVGEFQIRVERDN
jgi:galactose mutarotase-like enzyme